ncbi:glutathione peroxidase [Marininema halotolerans]|uniref:Glutathione peroxidase n=1 Tax=Marininema halotolerans TaxID=1155944 RepID=A0A1I6PCB0_9BACL|nr:glutathione peroxidase [Marininema halotolerans]SFS37852.1 glutathione peroxidase [Marininema halotolerans]
MSVHTFTATTINGEEQSLSIYQGKVLLIVNTASKCGFTFQYAELQDLFLTYRDHGFHVLGFPSNQFLRQEPGTDDEIEEFCQLNYGVSFPLFSKIDVKGPNMHPLYRYLVYNAPGVFNKTIKWNFTKFLVDKSGSVIQRYSPMTKPWVIRDDIEKALAQ